MNKIQYGIERGYGYNPDDGTVSSTIGVVSGIFLGLLLGAMGGLDMGGPVNKIAFVTCAFLTAASADQTGSAAEILQRPMGSLACAIPVAPLGMGVATFVLPNKFDKESRNMGVGAFIMGCIGISEGAIPFAIRDPKRAIVCNVLGSALAGALGGAMGVQDAAAHGGPIVAILGAVPYGVQTLYYFIAAGAGVAVTALVYIF
ncbi:hypothetical protein Zmor_012158 [Zophobas morio]|uniref:PTS EIIC type-2 domain-containing protein n=1 Tax=Zophobas morio TaxID=2755281 RepID=A0AA38HH77_9CUCU|nr:hypothetical protein Zmor_012158 [Zophobas morio]